MARRGGLTRVDAEYRQAVLRRKAKARQNCPLFEKRRAEAMRDYLPTDEIMQPVFVHRLKLAESSAAHGNCSSAYREIGEAKRFGRRYQRRRNEDE